MSSHDEKDLLTRELRERSSDVGGHPIGFEAVRKSARRIQRRRQVLAGAVAAVVLAIAVPTALTVTGLDETAPGPVAPGPSPTRTVEPTPKPKPSPVGDVVLTLDGLERGADPSIPYVVGTVLHEQDASTLDLDNEYHAILPFGGGWMGTSFKEGEWKVTWLDANGHPTESAPGADRLAVTADGQHVAYFSPDPSGSGTLTVEGPGNEKLTWRTPAGEQVNPVGMLGDRTVVVESYGTNPKVELATPDGRIQAVPGLIAARGASDVSGLVSGQTSYSDTGSCWSVLDPAAGRSLWKTCDFALGQFSPDGRYVVGTDAYGDGSGGGQVALIDASSKDVVVRFAKARNDRSIVATPLTWEDASHVLAEVFRDGQWMLVRLGLDGSMELAADPQPGEEMTPAFHLGTRP